MELIIGLSLGIFGVLMILNFGEARLLHSLADQVDPEVSALLVIDMQNDFVADEGKIARMGRNVKPVQETVPGINRLIEAARKAGVKVVWIKTTHTLGDALPNYLAHTPARKEGVPLKDEDLICRPNHWASEYYDKLMKPLSDEIEVVKNCYGAFQETDLGEYLKANHIRTIICTGTSTNVCVLNTALQGFHQGYYTVMVTDCTSSTEQTLHDAILENHKRTFGHTATSQEIIGCWNR